MQKSIFFLVLFLACMNLESRNLSGMGTDKISIAVVAGGHSFDTIEFVSMLSSFSEISFEVLMQPGANQMIERGELDKYDVLVFYDMWPTINSKQIEGYYSLLNQGKGMVFLHHSLCSYQEWDEFKMIVGGKYYMERSGVDPAKISNYKHDLNLNIEIADTEHPVTSGLDAFTIHDEGYGNIEVIKDVELLIHADHPDCAPDLGWTHTYENSKIVYLMLGHDKHAYSNANFSQLLKNAIQYVN